MSLRSKSGSVALVALCCLAVLGIILAGYLGVSNLTMRVSNRTYAKDVSRHLAEMGLERALRSFNANTFGSGWTISGIKATRSTAPAWTYGTSGISAAINIRVDHYLAANKTANWSVLTTYAVGDFVWFQGVWYLCTSVPSSNQDPSNTSYWKSAPELWNANVNYKIDNIVLAGGTAYRCIADNINKTPFDSHNTTYWTGYAVTAWNSATTYAINDLVFAGGASYRCLSANLNKTPTNPLNSAYWLRTGFSVSAWNSAAAYSVDDIALSGGAAYRCIVSNSNTSPPNTTYWLSAPLIYAEGVATLPDLIKQPDGSYISDTIKTQLLAHLAPAPLFPNALAAVTLTNLSAGGTADSYNSVLGIYNQQTSPFDVPGTAPNPGPNLGSSAVIAGANTSSSAVTITTARINGYIAAPSSATSPYNPRWTYSGTGILTDMPVTTGIPSPRVDLTRVSRSPYIPQYDIQSITANNALTVSSGATTLPNVGTDVMSSDGKYYYYTNGSLYIDTGYTLTINGPVVIDVRPSSTADLTIQGSGKIIITNNATASLQITFGDELYIGSNSGGGIQNGTLDPKRCILIGTSTYNLSGYHYFWSNIPFYGVIYMPNAYVHLWNNGYTEHFYGAISAKNIYFNHVAALHYDTSLRTAVFSGIDAPYMISEWRELTDATERVILP